MRSAMFLIALLLFSPLSAWAGSPTMTWVSSPDALAFERPEGVPVASLEPLDAARSGDDTLVVLLRPGDLMLLSKDEGATWALRTLEMKLRGVTPGVKQWWGLGDLSPRGVVQRVVESRDAGETWRLTSTRKVLRPDPRLLTQVDKVLVLATSDHLVWSSNRGDRWRYVNPLVEEPITALHHASKAWWVGGERGAVSKGDRRGRGWKVERLPVEVEVRGFASGASGVLAATASGLWRRSRGAWTEVEALAERDLRGVSVREDGAGVAYGGSGRLAVTRDGGASWEDVTAEARRAAKLEGLAAHRLVWRHALWVEGGVLLLGDEARILRVEL